MRPKNLIKWATAVVCAGLLAAACSSTTTSSGTPAGIPTGGTKVQGGVVRFAEPPSTTINYIFPFMAAQFSSVVNISQFQYLLYRPLYMWGDPSTSAPVLSTALSLAQTPQYSSNATQAVINMKNYKWSNGEDVTATDVAFFLNMLHANTANWYAYVPGTIPDDISSVTVNSPTQLTITFKAGANPTWRTDNEFGQVTPFPKAWDITKAGGAPGSGGCSAGAWAAAATDAACTAVYNYLASQASNISGYASSPLWSVVDGPWKLKSLDSSGNGAFVPNTAYSGPQKATISEFDYVPFTTYDAEFNALVGKQVDLGYLLPPTNVPCCAKDANTAGPNNARLAGSYYMVPWVLFSFNYGVPKFLSNGNNGTAGKVFSQLYFRQAFQELIDQPLYITRALEGYGVPTYGPITDAPPNSFIDSYVRSNPYPYNPAKAKSTLTAHGWNVVPGGVTTCAKPGTGPGECGAGIPAGTPLNFTLAYATGTPWQEVIVQAEQSSWAQAGIKVGLSAQVFNTVISSYAGPCKDVASCNVELGWWGGGWSYEPDYYPSGELLFQTGAGSNASNFSDPMADSLIKATNFTNVNLNAYQDYIAQQLPFFWQPNADYQLSEFASKLRGAAPQSAYSTIFPEYYYWVK